VVDAEERPASGLNLQQRANKILASIFASMLTMRMK
jgi:hypothetical protein